MAKYQNTAQGLATLGRGGDSTLVHMNPSEVAGLQNLAIQNGTSLTVNPNTGMPEAFNLSGLLPMVIGGGLAATGMSPLMAGLLVGGATAVVEGDIGAGLGAGLGSFGGANLMSSLQTLGTAAADPTLTTGTEVTDAIQTDISSAANPGLSQATQYNQPGMFGVENNLMQGPSSLGTPAVPPGSNAMPQTSMMQNQSITDPTAFRGPINTNIGPRMTPQPTNPTFGNAIPEAGSYNPALRNEFASRGMPPAAGPDFNSTVTGSPGFKQPINQSMMTNPNMQGQSLDPLTNLGNRVGNNISTSFDQAGKGVDTLINDYDRAKELLGRDKIVEQFDKLGNVTGKTIERVPLDNMDMAMKFGMPVATGVMSGLEESDFYDGIDTTQFEDNRFRGPEDQLNLSGVTSLNLNAPYSNIGGGRGGLGLRGLLASGGEVKKYEEGGDVGGGVTGAGLAPGTPVAGAVGVSETMSGPGGTESFSEMVASGIHPANAAAMLGMDTAPYLDTGPGMEFTGTPSTPTSSGIGTLPPPPAPFSPDPGFDYETYSGGYMDTGLGAGIPVGMDSGYVYRGPTPIRRRDSSTLLASGGYLGGGDVDGQGDGMSDDIPASIDNEQPAALSEGEFVIPADVVSHIGNGSSEAGAKEFYGMMDRVRMARTGRKKQSPEIDPERFMPA